MKNAPCALRMGALATLAMGVVMTVSCSQSAPVATPPPPSEVGRYQIVVTTEGEHGSILFLVDTKEGMTWVYRPPQGPAINGYWSDIPRFNYGNDYWLRVFSQMAQQPPRPSSPPSGTTNAPAPAETNR